jgi:hypothetical protein
VANQTFNRAKLMNVGFVEASRMYSWQCYIFHDVDLLPEDDRNLYSCPDMPRHLSVAVDKFGYKWVLLFRWNPFSYPSSDFLMEEYLVESALSPDNNTCRWMASQTIIGAGVERTMIFLLELVYRGFPYLATLSKSLATKWSNTQRKARIQWTGWLNSFR